MRCYKGIYIASQNQTVPCGQCMACRINKGRLWTSRILMEQATHPTYSWFITLTYNDERLPATLDCDAAPVATLTKKKFLKWLDNQSANLGGFRYYAVGEYGDLRGRPHYHLALFPKSPEQASALCHNWSRRFGFASISEITRERARYLAGYTTKKLTAADDDRLKGNQEPEFRTSSRRPPLGAAFVDTLIDYYRTNKKAEAVLADRGDIERSFRLDGCRYPLGRWPLQKIRESLNIPLLHKERSEHANYLEYHDIEEAECDHENHRKQEANLNAKKTQRLHRSQAIKL